MRTQMTFLIAAAVAIFINGVVAECDKTPADFNMENCCKFPSFGIDGAVMKISNQLKDQKLDEYMSECKVNEALYNEFKWVKDNGIDKEAILKYTDTQIKEDPWKSVLKSAIATCAKDITDKKDEILKELAGPPFNISKDQCNGIFMSMTTCSQLESFVNCPKDAWTDEKRCTDAKAWVNKCGDVDSLLQLKKKH